MKTLALSLTLLASLLAQSQPGRNQLSGSVIGPDKRPVPNTSILITALPPSGPALFTFQPYNLRIDVPPSGVFSVPNVPDGTYVLCPGSRDALLLNPCSWRKPTEIKVSGGQNVAVPPIELIPAERMVVRIDDPAGHLRANLGKTARAEYHITVLTGQNLPALARQVADDPSGHSYEVLVAPDQTVNLIVNSGFFRFGDAQSRGLSRRPGLVSFDPIPIPPAARGAVRSAQVRVLGIQTSAP